MFKQYVVDTFTDTLFTGNPTAICLVDAFPSEALMLRITRENALTHTSFLLCKAPGLYALRWFTPKLEADLVGHATMAAAYAVLHILEPEAPAVTFDTMAGPLTVTRRESLLELDFPAYTLKRLEVTDRLVDALGARPVELWRARDLLAVFDDPKTVEALLPDLEKLKQLKGAMMQVTAPGCGDFDCVSRTFGPKVGMDEDPVCGSGHCHIIPYWAARTGKTAFTARQASPRGGTLYCRLEGDRVLLAGQARLYSICQLMMEENP